MLTIAAAVVALFSSAVPPQWHVQGRLTGGGGEPVDGTYDLVLALYEAETGGTALWALEYEDVTLSDGVFSVAITGQSATLLAAGPALWLEFKVQGEPALPRRPIGSVPYAILAGAAESLACSGCVGSSELAEAAVTGPSIQAGAITPEKLSETYVRRPGDTMTGPLAMSGASAALTVDGDPAGSVRIVNNPTEPTGVVLNDGEKDTVVVRASGDSSFDGGNLGVGITTPNAGLHVRRHGLPVGPSAEFDPEALPVALFDAVGVAPRAGSLGVYGTNVPGPDSVALASYASGESGLAFATRLVSFDDEGAETADELKTRMVITGQGRVGIGVTDPQRLLHLANGGLALSTVVPGGDARLDLDVGRVADLPGTTWNDLYSCNDYCSGLFLVRLWRAADSANIVLALVLFNGGFYGADVSIVGNLRQKTQQAPGKFAPTFRGVGSGGSGPYTLQVRADVGGPFHASFARLAL